jgi:hypothetical protein
MIRIIRSGEPRETPADKKFREFHAKNPHVYALLEEYAQEVWDLGYRRIGINLLIERVRWFGMVTTTDKDYKVNQNYASRYARLIRDNHPEWAGLFELRSLRS